MPRRMRPRPSPGGNAGFGRPIEGRRSSRPLALRSGSRLPMVSSAKTASPARPPRAPREFAPKSRRFAARPGLPRMRWSLCLRRRAQHRPPHARLSVSPMTPRSSLPRFARPRFSIPPSRGRARSPCGRRHSSATHRVDCRISPHLGDIHRVKVTTHTSLMNDHDFLI
jgi:hypothetical protein